MAVREVTPPLQVVCKWKIDESIFDLIFATWNPTIVLANIQRSRKKKKKVRENEAQGLVCSVSQGTLLSHRFL